MGRAPTWTTSTAAGTVAVIVSERADGDFHLDNVTAEVLERRRRALVDRPWTMLDERHGTVVVGVDAPGAHDRAVGDGLITRCSDAVLGIWAGDCAPVVLVADDGTLAAVHAGWRGLAAGIVDVAVDSFGGRADAVPPALAWLGPRIGPCCYEFGAADLVAVAGALGLEPAAITGVTTTGSPALDVPAAIAAVLARRGVDMIDSGRCTGCEAAWYSHRARRDVGRHVVGAWRVGT